MPKNTFYNLDKEKRARVLDAALEEFGSCTQVGVLSLIFRDFRK